MKVERNINTVESEMSYKVLKCHRWSLRKIAASYPCLSGVQTINFQQSSKNQIWNDMIK